MTVNQRGYIQKFCIFVLKYWYKFLIGLLLMSYINSILSTVTSRGSYTHFVSVWYNPFAILVDTLLGLVFVTQVYFPPHYPKDLLMLGLYYVYYLVMFTIG